MKYTRYDYKRKKNDNAILAIVLFSILILAFFIGTVISNFLIKNNNVGIMLPNPVDSAKVSNAVSTKIDKFIAIQGGKFLKSENLEKVKKNLSDYGNPFVIQEQDGSRLLLGIYNENESTNLVKQLTDKNIENSKITFQVQIENNLCNEEITAIISAELEILNKLSDKSIKSIKTEEIKKWCLSLQEVDSKSANLNTLKDLKVHINELPKDLTADKVPDCEIYIYDLLKKLITTNK